MLSLAHSNAPLSRDILNDICVGTIAIAGYNLRNRKKLGYVYGLKTTYRPIFEMISIYVVRCTYKGTVRYQLISADKESECVRVHIRGLFASILVLVDERYSIGVSSCTIIRFVQVHLMITVLVQRLVRHR